MQSRYYSPKTGRFINADGLTSTGQGFLGNNMFAYCLNNPVRWCDPDGLCTRDNILPMMIDCGKTSCPYKATNSFEKVLLSFASPKESGNTFSAGFSVSSTNGGLSQGASVCLSSDSSYNYALQATTSYGAGMGVGVSGAITMTYTNANNVQDLTGTSESTGGSLVALNGIAVDYISFVPQSDPTKTCWGICVSISAGSQLEGHKNYNYATSTESWNPWLVLRDLFY